MSFLFAQSVPSYAQEQLSTQLSALSTLPLTSSSPAATSSLRRSGTASPYHDEDELDPSYVEALSTLSRADVSKDELIKLLKTLSKSELGTASTGNRADAAMREEVMGRATTIAWKEVMEVLIRAALELEEERGWWESSVNSRRGVGIYLIQSLPIRLYKALNPHSLPDFLASFHPSNIHLRFPSRTALFRPLPNASTASAAALTSITSPYTLTRREMLSSVRALASTRDALAQRIGTLAAEGPQWANVESDSSSSGAGPSGAGVQQAGQEMSVQAHSDRLYSVLARVLDVPPPTAPSTSSSPAGSVTAHATPSKRRQASFAPHPPPPSAPSPSASPASLLALLTTHLPRLESSISSTLSTHSRPSALTRLWFPLLFLPPVLLTTSRALVRNKAWLEDQLRNGKETVRGFLVQWVWEPVEDIAKTLRSGGEGLGVAPSTVKSDQESLERMVLDLGRDYYGLKGEGLEVLKGKVRGGDMEEVLRVYEKEMQSPVKNALMGSLIRTLLIQVQKTKTDLSLSLLSLDHLLRSQQLTFAFVGVAPSVLVLYGFIGWARGVWRGDKRGKGRRRHYYNGLREIERILLSAPKHSDDLSSRDRGLLIVSVTGMRTWAAGLGGNRREGFLADLRMVEDPNLRRGDKLRVVERIWRCFGVDGRLRI